MCVVSSESICKEEGHISISISSNIYSQISSYVFNKTGMVEEDEHTPGRPYGGVALICKRIDGLIYEPINCDNSRIIAMLIKDMNDNPVHLIISVYMPYSDRGVSRLTNEYVECVEAI